MGTRSSEPAPVGPRPMSARPIGAPTRGGGRGPVGVTVVIPTIGRPSLAAALAALAGQVPPAADWPVELVIVDDRREPAHPLPVVVPAELAPCTRTVPGCGRGPAAARNTGWRAAGHPWVAFLDDDVLPDPGWLAALRRDLAVPASVGGVQGRVRVPLPDDRRHTDWERGTAGLADGKWITADMAYRRSALLATGGFDERFRRAFREDAELAYRVRAAGWSLARGTRQVTHPVRPEDPWISVRTQRGNADDALLRRMYGPNWRRILDVPPGRRRRHAVVTAAGLTAVGLAAAGFVAAPDRRRGWRFAAALAGAGWLAGTAEFAAARIAPGPRTAGEIGTMLATSVIIPPLAVAHWLRGWSTARHQRPLGAAAPPARPPGEAPGGTRLRVAPGEPGEPGGHRRAPVREGVVSGR